MERKKTLLERGKKVNVEVHLSGTSRTRKAELSSLGLNGITSEPTTSGEIIRGSVKETKQYDIAQRAGEDQDGIDSENRGVIIRG